MKFLDLSAGQFLSCLMGVDLLMYRTLSIGQGYRALGGVAVSLGSDSGDGGRDEGCEGGFDIGSG